MATRLNAGINRRDKSSRQRRIAQILRTREVESQADLAKLLVKSGDDVTQATLSRDLEELGAYKARDGSGHVVYRVPDEPSLPEDWLKRMLREFAVRIDSSANLCVIKTPPGGAGAVARALDNATVPDVLGTIAGDDTILVVAKKGVAGSALAKQLRLLSGLKGDRT